MSRKTTSPDSGPAFPSKARLPWYPWIGKRPFFGWVVVASGAVTQFIQGIANQGFSTYLPYFETQFGWSKAALAGGRSLMQVQNSVLGPLGGILVDKLGPRLTSLAGTCIMSIGLLLFSNIHSMLTFYLANVVVALGCSMQGLLTTSIAVNYWFRKKRSLAQSLMLSGYALTGVIAIPVLVYLQSSLGWPTAAVISSIFVLVTGIPAGIYIVRGPEHYGLLPDGVPVPPASGTADKRANNTEERGLTLREALRTRVFWFIGISNGLGAFGMTSIQTHVFLHLEQDVKLAPAAAALVWSIASISNIPARLLGGFIGDRKPKYIMLSSAIMIVAASSLVLAFSNSMFMAIVFALLYGIGWGMRTPLYTSIQGDYFGVKSLGVIAGWLSFINVPFGIVAPIMSGLLADIQGNYKLSFIIVGIVTMLGSVLALLSPPPKHNLPRTY